MIVNELPEWLDKITERYDASDALAKQDKKKANVVFTK